MRAFFYAPFIMAAYEALSLLLPLRVNFLVKLLLCDDISLCQVESDNRC